MSICLGKDRVSFEFSSIYFNILNFLLLGFVITFAEHLFCFFTWILECIPGRIMSLKHLSWFLFFLALLPAVLYLARKGPWYILKPSALRRRFSSLVRLLRWKQSKMVEDGWLFLREYLSRCLTELFIRLCLSLYSSVWAYIMQLKKSVFNSIFNCLAFVCFILDRGAFLLFYSMYLEPSRMFHIELFAKIAIALKTSALLVCDCFLNTPMIWSILRNLKAVFSIQFLTL